MDSFLEGLNTRARNALIACGYYSAEHIRDTMLAAGVTADYLISGIPNVGKKTAAHIKERMRAEIPDLASLEECAQLRNKCRLDLFKLVQLKQDPVIRAVAQSVTRRLCTKAHTYESLDHVQEATFRLVDVLPSLTRSRYVEWWLADVITTHVNAMMIYIRRNTHE